MAFEEIRDGTGSGVTFDIFRIRADGSDGGVPWLVTTTDSSRDREIQPTCKSDWINDIDVP